MKDLYKPLGLSGPESSWADIRRALKDQTLRPDTVRHATAVLLNSQRRAAYDRTWRTLKTIGSLRANLELGCGGHWGPDCADFESVNQRKTTLRNGSVQWKKTGPTITFLALMGYCVFEALSIKPGTRAVGGSDFLSSPVTPEATPSSLAVFEDDTSLSRNQVCELQERLSSLGYYTAPVDGIHGPKSQGAVVSYRRGNNYPSASDATLGLLNHLRQTQSMNPRDPYQPMPSNGTIFDYSGASAVAPFEVKTSAARRGYLVKVKTVGQSQGQEQVIKSFFVAGGSTFLTKLPLGLYQVHYAAGDNWLSYPCAFGKDTIFSRAEATFEFSVEFGRVKGYTVDLIPQLNGNLRTTQIDAKEF